MLSLQIRRYQIMRLTYHHPQFTLFTPACIDRSVSTCGEAPQTGLPLESNRVTSGRREWLVHQAPQPSEPADNLTKPLPSVSEALAHSYKTTRPRSSRADSGDRPPRSPSLRPDPSRTSHKKTVASNKTRGREKPDLYFRSEAIKPLQMTCSPLYRPTDGYKPSTPNSEPYPRQSKALLLEWAGVPSARCLLKAQAGGTG